MGALIVQTWLSDVDRDILLFYRDHDIVVKPATIARNAENDRAQNSMRRRLWKLDDAGIVDSDENNYYELTDLGRELINDELSKTELERLEPED
jgi:Mn-dependent DtxR family transcriptional regulator